MSDVMWKILVYNGELFDKFEISTNGEVRNARTKKVYKTFVNKNGYVQLFTTLGSRNKTKVFRVHKAVAETFVANPENKPEVNHIDGNKQNNSVANLEWVTSKENNKHAIENGLRKPLQGTNNPLSKLSADDVLYIREHYIPRSNEYGARALGRKFNVDHGTILDIIKNFSYTNV